MRELPRGTVTFLFTDIEGSTRLLHELGDGYAGVLAEHRRLLRDAFERHGGVEVDTQGDAFFVAFRRAGDAVACAADAQAALAESPVRVRMGIHTGEPLVTDEGYVGVDVHRAARIAAAGHGGQVLLSQTTRDLVEADVRDRGECRLKDLTAPVRLYQLGFGDFPPLATLDMSNLPIAASPLVGRDLEVDEIIGLFRDGYRLVTITGTGGIGKTRVGLQVAAELTGSFRDGVWWVPLAGISSAELMLPAIASALETRDDVLSHVRRRDLLLVLDSLEHLLAGATSLADLLAAAPSLRLLVTSRSRLHLSGEREYPLDALPTPDAAVLFVERARSAGRVLPLDAKVEELCKRLDNLPLTLELAAARTKLLDPEALLYRLERRLPVLTGGPRDAPERHRTLHGTIDWSYDLLDPAGRALFPQVAVFVGPFSVEAAEEVASAELDTLSALVDASMLKSLGRGLLLMLDTIREYALERLQPGEVWDLRRRHAAYYARVADCRWTGLVRGDDPEWRAIVHGERDNLHSALEWALEHDAAEDALAILSGIWPAENDLRLLSGWLQRALALPSEPVTLRRAFALAALADSAHFQGDLDAAEEAAEEALSLFRLLSEPRWVAAQLSTLADISVERGDLKDARRLAEESVAIRRERLQSFGLARGLASLAYVALAEGETDRARAAAEEAVAWLREVEPDGLHLPEILCLLAEVLRRQGELDSAETAFLEALRLAAPVDHAFVIAEALDGLAALRWELGGSEEARRLAGAAQRARDDLGHARPYPDRPVPDRIEPAWSEGLGMTLGEAVEYALRDID